jgi:predicted DCC family thiol-disulfide oxidoreductase YuxK
MHHLERAIHIADATGMLGVGVLLRAARDGRISLHVSQPENAHDFKNWAKAATQRPAIVLVGDDDGLQRGATAWLRLQDGALEHARHGTCGGG